MGNNFGNKTWRPTKPKDKFNPTREFINSAVDDYLKPGGKITKIEELEEVNYFSDQIAVYEFLKGD